MEHFYITKQKTMNMNKVVSFVIMLGFSIVTNASFYLDENEFSDLQKQSEHGDATASYRLFEHFYWGLDDVENSQKWLELSVAQGSLDARLSFSSLCVNKIIVCNHDKAIAYLREVILKSDEQEAIIYAYNYLGDFYVDSNTELAIDYYLYGASFSNVISVSKIFDIYKGDESELYNQLYWSKRLLDFAKKRSAQAKYLNGLIAVLENKLSGRK